MVTKEECIILYSIMLVIFSIFLFLFGFFPEKTNYLHSTMGDLPVSVDGQRVDPRLYYRQHKPRLVIMIIDSLRYDFIYGINSKEYMPYVSEQLENKTCFLKARVEPPTVTMPRIKALVTGAIPGFYDIVKNFGNNQLMDDNLVFQALSKNMNIIFYGDETWLKLFPNSFLRSEGTNSFYVNDYTEVDNNVTRHLDYELYTNDWDVMILHYLGLDHLGHTKGPNNILTKRKLLEMDKIIMRIHQKLIQKNPDNPGVLLICGDHGMKDSGGHGGTSLQEVLVPILLLNYKCDPLLGYEEMKQVDVTPLLSALLGLPIPGGSVGVLGLPLLSGLDLKSALFILHYNTQRMLTLYEMSAQSSSSMIALSQYASAGANLYKNWIESNFSSNDYFTAAAYFHLAQLGMSNSIIKASVHFDTYLLIIAMVISFQAIVHLLNINQQNHHVKARAAHLICFFFLLGSHFYICFLFDCDSILCQRSFSHLLLILFVFGLLFTNFCCFKNFSITLNSPQVPQKIYVILISGTLLHMVSLTSSSFIEEEHQIWYFLITTILLFLLPFDWYYFGILLGLQLFLRKLNQTGDKWAHLSDIGDWLNSVNNKSFLSIFYAIGLVMIFYCQRKKFNIKRERYFYLMDDLFAIGQLISVYCIRVAVGSCTIGIINYEISRGITEARFFWVFSLSRNLFNIFFMVYRWKSKYFAQYISGFILKNFTFILSYLLKPHNIYLIPSMYLFSDVFSSSFSNDPVILAVIHYWLGCMFYFYQGNSNSIANIDISVGYIGLEEFNAVITGLFIALHTLMGPITAFLLLIENFVKNHMCFSEGIRKAYSTLMLINVSNILFYMIVITVLRHHLFIWSVFTPKLLFFSTQTFINSVNVALAVLFNISFKHLH